MKGISNPDGITFGDLIDFVDNNRSSLPDNTVIRLELNFDDNNNQLRDILVPSDFSCIRMYNYI